MKHRFTYRLRPLAMAGTNGFWFDVIDARRRVVRSGWSAGRRRFAVDDARLAIQELTRIESGAVAA